MTTVPTQRFVGTSVPRAEDDRILSGTATYVDDLQLPGMLHAVFFRSPLAHANILQIDVSEARSLPGVHAVLTGIDIEALLNPEAGSPGIWMSENVQFPVIAITRVRFVGDLIAVVVAESRYLAVRISMHSVTVSTTGRQLQDPLAAEHPKYRS